MALVARIVSQKTGLSPSEVPLDDADSIADIPDNGPLDLLPMRAARLVGVSFG